MAKVISQETFDNVVQENIIEFSMTAIDAVDETINQFKAQGINLANIIKDLSINEESGRPILNESIENMKMHISGEEKLNNADLIKNVEIFEAECKKSVPHRVLAGKLNGHQVLISIIDSVYLSSIKCDDLILICLKAGSALTNKHPDIFDAETLAILIKVIKNETNNNKIICCSLQWLSRACVMHETNRQNIINADIVKYLKPFMSSNDPQVIRDLCTLYRYLILDDDIRVEFGKAHEHARLISNAFLADLTKLLGEFEDVNVLSDLCLTIASLAVRQELCVVIEKAGGLKYVLDLMNKYPTDIKLNRECLKVLKALAGHDQVKILIIEHGAAPIIRNILDNHRANESLAKITLACISTITLRVKNNSLAFFATNIPELIVDTMRVHPNSIPVQRNGAWSIRNMVARLREYCHTFLSNDAEILLNAAMVKHPSILQDLKAALRDLNCKVDLKEEWTGKSEKKIMN